MRILLANSTCKAGGVSTFMLSLRRGLLAAGHECELFFFERGPMADLLPSDCSARFGTLADCLRLVAGKPFDLVHANNVDWPTGISAVRQIGARLLLTAHKVRVNGTYGWNSRNCDSFAAVANWIARDLQPSIDLPIATVPNGVDTSHFIPLGNHIETGGERPIVAWIGRAGSPHKRLDRLAAVAPLLSRGGARIWVVDPHGPDALAALYGHSVAELLKSYADRWEAIPFDRMPELYRHVAASGGCVLSTSASEGMPLTLLEAQACGCPVIATAVRGNDECVGSGSGGFLFPADLGPRELSTLVLDTLADSRRVEQLQRIAPDYVRSRFSLERVVGRYIELYRQIPHVVPTPWRARIRLTPLANWAGYREYRWGVGYLQYEAAEMLARSGNTTLAAAAVLASWHTAPTMYLRPHRLRRLSRARWNHFRSSAKAKLQQWLAVSPRQKAPKPCGTDDILDGRKPAQMGWYGFASELVRGQQVLDVGCGSGEGLKILAAEARDAMGIDLDERLRRPDVRVEIKSIADVPAKSFDVVVCLDVIEHITDDRAFVAELFRVARKAVFVTTPNYTMSRNRHPYHVREYTPGEFAKVFAGYGDITLYAGSAHGFERVEISQRWRYFLVNALYIWRPMQLPAKVLKRLLGVTIWKHNAALVTLRSGESAEPRGAAAAA